MMHSLLGGSTFKSTKYEIKKSSSCVTFLGLNPGTLSAGCSENVAHLWVKHFLYVYPFNFDDCCRYKCLKQIKLPVTLPTCASCSELPSYRYHFLWRFRDKKGTSKWHKKDVHYLYPVFWKALTYNMSNVQ